VGLGVVDAKLKNNIQEVINMEDSEKELEELMDWLNTE